MKKSEYLNILTGMCICIILSQYLGEKFKFLFEIYLVLIMPYLFIIKKKIYNIKIDSIKKPFLIYLVAMYLICTLIEFNDGGVITSFFRMFLLSLICYRIIAVYGKNYIVDFFSGFTKIMFIINIIGIYEGINNTNLFYKYLPPSYEERFSNIGLTIFRESSVFIHPIIFGNILVITLAILFILKNKFSVLYKFISVILIFINLYNTQSRSSWLACIALIVLYILLKVKNKKILTTKNLLKIFLTILLLGSFIIIFNKQVISVTEQINYRITFEDGSEVSKNQRLGAAKNVIENISKHPIQIICGNGINSIHKFMENNVVELNEFNIADDQYITFIYDVGLGFVIVYIIYILKCLQYAFKTNDINKLLPSFILFVISINMFFYEAFTWKLILVFIFVSILFDCCYIKNDKFRI
jgi:hypothetical protein